MTSEVLLPGEKVLIELSDVSYICPYDTGSAVGSILVTTYKFSFRQNQNADKVSTVIKVPLCTISRVEKIDGVSSPAARGSDNKSPYGLEIHCKDLRVLRFLMSRENHQRRVLLEKLQESCFPASNKRQFFAYQFKENFSDEVHGWNVYKSVTEYERMGLEVYRVPVEGWRFTKANQKYELCDTYPQLLAVPSAASDEDLRNVAQFRSKNRIPVLSWIHPESQATITRCAQPLVGIGNKRSREDERYLHLILEANPHAHKLLIFDARPQQNAVANVARGGGYEKSEAYSTSELKFCDIANIHVMRESLRKLHDVCANEDKNWLAGISSTDWLYHIKLILAASAQIATRVDVGKSSVLVHCSDGWDRTPQMTSLAMIMLDSYYRTLEGFMVLIEKEWLSFGHKFSQRVGHGDKNHSDAERSPVFVQFIDAVWQITRQFEAAFEFNQHFLITILEHLYSCLFGTFLYNCDKDRKTNDVKKRTKSLWTYVLTKRDNYLNPLYASAYQNHVLIPIAAVRHLEFWSAYYNRWNPRTRMQESVAQRNKELLMIKERLRQKVEQLERKRAEKQKLQTPTPSIQIVQES